MTFETKITYLFVNIDDGHADHPHIGMFDIVNHETTSFFNEHDQTVRRSSAKNIVLLYNSMHFQGVSSKMHI